MKNQTIYSIGKGKLTFSGSKNLLWLENLFGLGCDQINEEIPELVCNLFSIASGDSSLALNIELFRLTDSSFNDNSATLTWENESSELKLHSRWLLDDSLNIISRKDVLTNISSRPINIKQCMASFPFSPNHYEIYHQSSKWCRENQGSWQSVENNALIYKCASGRTTNDYTPYICLREFDTRKALAIHILPTGNWKITASPKTSSALLVECGISNENMNWTLASGSKIELPEILIQSLPDGLPESAATNIQKYLLASSKQTKNSIPVIYNTWFYEFDRFSVEDLYSQLRAAKNIGCEIFVVDAGWYGPGDGDWAQQVGWWEEKKDAAFHNKMCDFADKVRKTDLGFGLWMEPERIGINAPILKKHPEWFLKSISSQYYPDLENPEVYSYIFSEMSRLIETYKLVWMKVDFNHEIGPDPRRKELVGYYEKWYSLLDEIEQKYPHVFFEGCASGGLRLDAVSLNHFDAQFPSDTVEPVEVLRITQGAALRLPVGRLTKWAVVRTVDNLCPYGSDPKKTSAAILTAATATWNRSISVDLDFLACTTILGGMGFSGDIASLTQEMQAKFIKYVDFYKSWREFIAASICHLLTPVEKIYNRNGWIGFQLQGIKVSMSLIFVFRLGDSEHEKIFMLKELDPNATYNIKDIQNQETIQLTGNQLMADGLKIMLPEEYRANIFIIKRH